MRGLGGLARRSLAARRLRTALTILGIGLGVTVLVAALIVNGALDGSVDRSVRDALGSASLRVTALEETGLSEASVTAIRGAPGVSVVGPVLERRTYPFVADVPDSGAALPAPLTVLGVDPAADQALHERTVALGTWLPAGAGGGGNARANQVVISEPLAREDGLAVGGTLTLLGGPDGGPVDFTVAGILAVDQTIADPLGRMALIPLAAAKALFETTAVTRAEAGLAPGATVDSVTAELDRTLTTDPYTLTTAADLAAALRASTRDFRSSIALVAAIALFGGAFLIFNTLAMTVRERARDIGLLRAAGMSRRQVIRFVLLIALQVGVAGAILGAVAGIGLAILVLAYLQPGGFDAVLRSIAIQPVSVGAGALLGLVVAVAAALEPAVRAGRIPPVEALTARLDQTAVLRARVRWLVVIFGVVGAGGLLLWPGALSSPGGLLVPIAVYALLLFVALLAPAVVRPIGAVATTLLRIILPVEARLARSSLLRERSRTGLTVGALAIAIAVFVALGGVAASTRQATVAWMTEVLPGDLVLTAVTPVTLDDAAALDLAGQPGVARFSPYARFSVASDGRRLDAAAVVGADLLADGRLVLVAGDRAAALAALDAGGAVILPQATADRLGVPLGGTLRVLSGRSVVPLTVVGIAAHTIPGDAGASILVGWREAIGQLGVTGADGFVVRFADGAAPAVRDALVTRARGAAFEPLDVGSLAGSLGDSIDRLYLLFGGLALVSLLVAALGIVNTLTMNVMERVRELAILRASGLTRGQAWRLVMFEAGILGLVGSVLGVLAGLGAGAVLVALGGSGASSAASAAGVAGSGVLAGVAGGGSAGGLAASGGVLGGIGSFAPAWGKCSWRWSAACCWRSWRRPTRRGWRRESRSCGRSSTTDRPGPSELTSEPDDRNAPRAGVARRPQNRVHPEQPLLDSRHTAPARTESPARAALEDRMTLATNRLNRLPAAERGITIGDFLVPIAIGERISTRARHTALVIAGAILIALSANVMLPLSGETITLVGNVRIILPNSPVPITLQTLSVLLVGGALGYRRGILATLLYLALGLVLPVYAGGNSGFDTFLADNGGRWVLGATGGYLLGFVLAGAIVGRLAELGWDRHVGGAVAAMLIGNALVYALGVPWLMSATGMDVGTALDKGVWPFLLWDLVKLAIAGILFPIAWWIVGRGVGER